MYSVYKHNLYLQNRKRERAKEKAQTAILDSPRRQKLNEKLTQQYKTKVAHFINKMSKNPEVVDDTKHRLDFSIPKRHQSTFRPSFDQNYNIKTGAGNNIDLAVSRLLALISVLGLHWNYSYRHFARDWADQDGVQRAGSTEGNTWQTIHHFPVLNPGLRRDETQDQEGALADAKTESPQSK